MLGGSAPYKKILGGSSPLSPPSPTPMYKCGVMGITCISFITCICIMNGIEVYGTIVLKY